MKKANALMWMILIFVLSLMLTSVDGEPAIVMERATESIEAEDGISNEEALDGFINNVLGMGLRGARTHRGVPQTAMRGNKLTGADKILYNFLRQSIEEVAVGNVSQTVFSIRYDQLFEKTSYTAEELLGSNEHEITEEAVNAFFKKIAVDSRSVLSALQADCPYELFWFDKTQSIGIIPSGAGSDGHTIYLPEDAQYTVSMYVAQEYSTSGTVGTTDYNTSVSRMIINASENAKKTVKQYSAMSDVAKLRAYMETICDMVSYNKEAARNSDVNYGNPWQLIWVFDDDPSTKVVCEGYAKAFKYLCDLSTFETDVSVFLVSGNMQGGTGAGDHMWNIVEMEGNRYLVDVTNCDSGTVGYPDQLFMTGYSVREDENTYIYLAGEDQIKYTYESAMQDLYSAEERNVLAEEGIERLSMPGFSNLTLTNGACARGELSVRVTFPEGAAVVCVSFYRLDENSEIMSKGPVFFLEEENTVTVLGYWIPEGGIYRLTAQALTHGAEGEAQLQDSKTAAYNIRISETAEPAEQLPDFSFPETLQYGESVTYEIPGVDGVVSLSSGDWGEDEPLENLSGNSQTIIFNEVGLTTIQFWGCKNHVWTASVTKTVIVEPLGTLSAPVVKWGGTLIEHSMFLNADDSLSFTVNAPEAERIWYEVRRQEDVASFMTGGDLIDGSAGTMDLSPLMEQPGDYGVFVSGRRAGYREGTFILYIHLMENGDYTVVEGMILKYHGSTSAVELSVPGAIEDQNVTGIGPEAFAERTELTAVILPDTLERIGDFAFRGCTGLNEITIPSGLTKLGKGAFMDSGLTRVNVPDTVMTRIWNFYEPDSSLNPRVYQVSLPEGITEVNAPFLRTAISGDTPDYMMPAYLTRIDDEAFADSGAQYVWIGNHTISIGQDAFSGCTGLRVRIPGSVTSIEDNAFPVGTVVYGETGSEGWRFALEHNLTFIPFVENCT